MKKVDHPNLASVHEVIDVTSDDALLSSSSFSFVFFSMSR
jgi:hypothetical protein